MGRFASGVAVATLDNGEKKYGITINSFSSVSLEPPLVLFCLDKQSSCHPAFLAAENFSLCFLSEKQKDVSRMFATPGEKEWQHVSHSKSPNSSQPVIDECLAYVECEKYNVYEGGDHSIILGKVTHLEMVSPEGMPLLYFKGEYVRL